MTKNSQANNEVLELLKHIPLKNYLKIPDSEITYLKTHTDESYYFKYNEENSIENQNISKEALIIFTRLYLTYIANKREQEHLKEMLKLNDLKKEISKKTYNSYDIFKNKDVTPSTNTLPIKVQKKGLFDNVLLIIKKFLSKFFR